MATGGGTYCRLCAELKPLTAVIDVENHIDDIITKLNRINATADLHSENVPKTVCMKCMTLLNGAYEFVLAVEKAQHTLMDVKLEIKDEICDIFEASDTTIEVKVEKEEQNSDLVEEAIIVIERQPLYEKPPIPITKSPADTSKVWIPISDATKEINETVKLNNKQKCEKKILQPSPNTLPTWEDYIWRCGICDTRFPTHEELKTHAMEFHQCCNTQQCSYCNYRRACLDRFITHIYQHKKDLKYSCYTCFKVLPNTHEAGLHRRTHKPTPHYCKGCNTTFETEDQLEFHTTTYFRLIYDYTASKTDDVKCKLCDKIFKQPSALIKHMKTHTERKRDYTCETCGKSFLHKPDLINHIIVHTDERPHPCNICKRRFKRRKHLLEHLELHTAEKKYTCDVCDRSFKFESYLKNHRVVHTNVLPFNCSYCDKKFRRRADLSQHLRQHTGAKPYTCSVCDWQFTNWPNYNKHMKTKHNMNMSKRNLIVKNDEVSENMKEDIETVGTVKKCGRKRKKLVADDTDHISSEN